MQKKTLELLKKFEQEHEVYVNAQDAQTFWIANARIPKEQESHHYSRKYVSGPNERGNVIIFQNYESSDAYTAENWGNLETFEDFVNKALNRILEDKTESERGESAECKTCP
jgi:hypothetical protein